MGMRNQNELYVMNDDYILTDEEIRANPDDAELPIWAQTACIECYKSDYSGCDKLMYDWIPWGNKYSEKLINYGIVYNNDDDISESRIRTR